MTPSTFANVTNHEQQYTSGISSLRERAGRKGTQPQHIDYLPKMTSHTVALTPLSSSSSSMSKTKTDVAESITSNHFQRDFVAGFIAGCVMRGTLFPVDTIKTNMQRSGTGIVNTIQHLTKSSAGGGGVLNLYRGLTPALLEIGINRGALMGVSTAVKKQLPEDIPELARDAGAGMVAGMLKTTILHPLDTLTCRGQVGSSKQWELLYPSKTNFQKLYQGFSPAIIRSSGGMSIWLCIRNSLTRSHTAQVSLENQPYLRDWLIGMTATCATDICTYPLDTLKKNLQADGGNVGSLLKRLVHPNEGGGILRLYRGYSPRLFMMAINGGLWNFVYVRVQDHMDTEC